MNDLPAADCCVPLNYLNRIPPFTTPKFDPAWKTADVVLLAKSIDADTAFDRMPILADALEEAGCDEERILTHCRYCDEHEIHCWLLEIIRNQIESTPSLDSQPNAPYEIDMTTVIPKPNPNLKYDLAFGYSLVAMFGYVFLMGLIYRIIDWIWQ